MVVPPFARAAHGTGGEQLLDLVEGGPADERPGVGPECFCGRRRACGRAIRDAVARFPGPSPHSSAAPEPRSAGGDPIERFLQRRREHRRLEQANERPAAVAACQGVVAAARWVLVVAGHGAARAHEEMLGVVGGFEVRPFRPQAPVEREVPERPGRGR